MDGDFNVIFVLKTQIKNLDSQEIEGWAKIEMSAASNKMISAEVKDCSL